MSWPNVMLCTQTLVQAELEKKNILLKSISDRINPDAVRQSPPLVTLPQNKDAAGSGGKSSRKKKRTDREDKLGVSADDKKLKKYASIHKLRPCHAAGTHTVPCRS